MEDIKESFVIVRGAGDLATGVIHKLVRSGFYVLALESDRPSAIRRHVSFCEAVYDGTSQVEGMTCDFVGSVKEKELEWLLTESCKSLKAGHVALCCDPSGKMIDYIKPMAVVDAIIAKKNLGTRMDMAKITIGLGPGFTAGKDVTCVIETKRGHNLGRIIYEGSALPNTGIPGIIEGYGKERVVHSPAEGIFMSDRKIGDLVTKGEMIAVIEKDGKKVPVTVLMSGLLRGLIRNGFYVTKGFKVADVDPRPSEYENCFTISDKSRAIAGGVLEALLYELRGKKI